MTELYRHFDAQGRLLYVGLSLCTAARLSQHRGYSPWFKQVTTITIERHKTRSQAALAEWIAIKHESPKFNTLKTARPVRYRKRDRIRSYRESHNIRPADLAKKLKIAESTLRSIENGTRKVTPEMAVAIEREIGISRAKFCPEIFRGMAA